MSWLLLGLHVRPHVVAATARLLVMAFTFGSCLAYVISGNLRVKHAVGYGLINLIVAPIGMALFQRAKLPSTALLLLSLTLGVAAMASFAGAELAPALDHLRDRLEGRATFRPLEDGFKLLRYCHTRKLVGVHA